MIAIKAWLPIIRAGIIAALFSAAMTYAYVKGGEGARAQLAALISKSAADKAIAEEKWNAKLSEITASETQARALARSAVAALNDTNADAEAKIEAARKSAVGALPSPDVVARVNVIVREANR